MKMDSWQVFMQRITEEHDLDPGYTALYEAELPQKHKERIVTAWATFYNMGIACKAAGFKSEGFWDYLRNVYPTAKRNSERRHFRGSAGSDALDAWQSRWPDPERMPQSICLGAKTYFDIRQRMGSIPMMGNYFIWKFCDLAGVLYDIDIDMTGSEKHSPDVPRKAINRHFWKDATVEEGYGRIVEAGLAKKLKAHPRFERPWGIAEAESIACVYKQMAQGYYLYGARTAKLIASLNATPSKCGEALKAGMLRVSPYDEHELLKEILPQAEEYKKQYRRQKLRAMREAREAGGAGVL